MNKHMSRLTDGFNPPTLTGYYYDTEHYLCTLSRILTGIHYILYENNNCDEELKFYDLCKRLGIINPNTIEIKYLRGMPTFDDKFTMPMLKLLSELSIEITKEMAQILDKNNTNK